MRNAQTAEVNFDQIVPKSCSGKWTTPVLKRCGFHTAFEGAERTVESVDCPRSVDSHFDTAFLQFAD
jgi:hypothetical protein